MSGRPKILFVDDEEGIRLTLPGVLESQGFDVTTASSVPDALALIVRYKFDLLISDLNINGVGDGFTVINAMRSAQPEALRFILTRYPDLERALEAVRSAVHEYIIKATETDALVAKLRVALADRPQSPPKMSRKRLAEVIRENRQSISEKWLDL